jgi:hypothetical protein
MAGVTALSEFLKAPVRGMPHHTRGNGLHNIEYIVPNTQRKESTKLLSYGLILFAAFLINYKRNHRLSGLLFVGSIRLIGS